MKRYLLILAALAFAALAGSSAEAATCFWVGGTATWDQTNTGGGGAGGIKWASTTGGGSACVATSGPVNGVPGPSDTAQFDGNSGGGTVTVAATVNSTNTLLAVTSTAYTGTIDGSVNGPSLTMSSWTSATAGSGSPVIKLGTGNITVTGGNGADFSGVNASSVLNAGTITMGGAVAAGNAQSFTGGGKTYGNLVLNSRTTGTSTSILGANTFSNITVNGPLRALFPAATTTTVSGNLTITGTSSGLVSLSGSAENASTVATLAVTGTVTATWAAFRAITLNVSTVTATSSFDLGANTGVTVVAPSAGGGGRIIGG